MLARRFSRVAGRRRRRAPFFAGLGTTTRSVSRLITAADLAPFDTAVPVAEALTAPAAWYTRPEFFEAEQRSTFDAGAWLHVGHAGQVARPGDFFAGQVVGEPYVVVRDLDGELRAHFNVCSHHAMAVASGAGNLADAAAAEKGAKRPCFRCPYHGWEYLPDGRLLRATQLKGIKNFRPRHNGLKPMAVDVFEGSLVFVNFDPEPEESLEDYCGAAGALLRRPGVPLAVAAAHTGPPATPLADLVHVHRREYELACNWKVFVDNYLDGGYHVAYAHPALAENVDMKQYTNEIHDGGRLSAQLVPGATDAATGGDADARLGAGASYLFLYPNLCINRYGPFVARQLFAEHFHTLELRVGAQTWYPVGLFPLRALCDFLDRTPTPCYRSTRATRGLFLTISSNRKPTTSAS